MENLIEILGSILLVVLSFLGKSLLTYLSTQIKSERLRSVLLRVSDAASNAVQSVAKSYADDLKAKAADGKLTQEERREARSKALKNMKDLLGTAGLEEVEKMFGLTGTRLDKALMDRIESTLKGLSK